MRKRAGSSPVARTKKESNRRALYAAVALFLLYGSGVEPARLEVLSPVPKRKQPSHPLCVGCFIFLADISFLLDIIILI